MTRLIDLDALKPKRRFKRRRWLFLLIIILALGGGLFALSRTSLGQSLLSPVSFVARLINPIKLKEVDGRVNVLVLGLDTRSSGWSGLTDTILVGSISPLEGDPALVSIPRDFWTDRSPYGQGKINTAYNYGGIQKDGKFDAQKGVEFFKSKIESVLGIKIPYWAVVNFEGFREVIDTLGGINVTVDRAFRDCSYPTPDYGYKCISFKAGPQVMNGEKSLEYARSRMGNNGEGSDFARVRRQQKVILGVKNKVFSANLLLNPVKLSKLYRDLTNAVHTNVSFGEIKKVLEIFGKLGDLSQIESLVLDPDSGLVYHPANSAPYGGAYVLVPKAGNFSKIQAAVRKLFFGSETGETSGGKP
jgi:LCP family protein required for cell wall assembly